MKRLNLPKNILPVTSYRGDLRVIKNQNLARIKEQRLWRCKVCGEYFQTLGEAKEHQHG
jgi:rubrerythrin